MHNQRGQGIRIDKSRQIFRERKVDFGGTSRFVKCSCCDTSCNTVLFLLPYDQLHKTYFRFYTTYKQHQQHASANLAVEMGGRTLLINTTNLRTKAFQKRFYRASGLLSIGFV